MYGIVILPIETYFLVQIIRYMKLNMKTFPRKYSVPFLLAVVYN